MKMDEFNNRNWRLFAFIVYTCWKAKAFISENNKKRLSKFELQSNVVRQLTF